MAYKIGWFSTGRGPGSRNLLKTILQTIERGSISAELSFVFCNREQGEAEGSDRYLEMVKDHGLNLVSFSSRNYKPEVRKQGNHNPVIMNEWRTAYDNEIMARLSPYTSDINVLAGYMLIVGSTMCEKYDLINLHPAAPDGPAGTWKEVIWQLIKERARCSGVMIHLVTKELDKGPPITFCTFPLVGPSLDPLWKGHDLRLKNESLAHIMEMEGERYGLFKEIREQGVKRELPLIVQTLKVFSEGKISIRDKQVFVNNRLQEKAYCLTEQIEISLTHGSRCG